MTDAAANWVSCYVVHPLHTFILLSVKPEELSCEYVLVIFYFLFLFRSTMTDFNSRKK